MIFFAIKRLTLFLCSRMVSSFVNTFNTEYLSGFDHIRLELKRDVTRVAIWHVFNRLS